MIHYGQHRVFVGDCVAWMSKLPANSVDAVVCDPPYGLEFMGKEWDAIGGDRLHGVVDAVSWGGAGSYARRRVRYGGAAYGTDAKVAGAAIQSWHTSWLTEALRILKPGGYLVAFSHARLGHRLWCAAEDVGFEIRDTLLWTYTCGMAKGMDVSKAIDKAAGAAREVVGPATRHAGQSYKWGDENRNPDHSEDKAAQTAPATPLAKLYDGYNTALSPAYEPILLARKPMIGTMVANVSKHGTGALNVDACRTAFTGDADKKSAKPAGRATSKPAGATGAEPDAGRNMDRVDFVPEQSAHGRWPKNVLLDPDAANMLDDATGITQSGYSPGFEGQAYAGPSHGVRRAQIKAENVYADSGGPSRCYPVLPLDDPEADPTFRFHHSGKITNKERAGTSHPTTKPLAVMRWLLRLVTPPQLPGRLPPLVVDPFLGSGTTLIAAEANGVRCWGAEQSQEYAAKVAVRWEARAAIIAASDARTKKKRAPTSPA